MFLLSCCLTHSLTNESYLSYPYLLFKELHARVWLIPYAVINKSCFVLLLSFFTSIKTLWCCLNRLEYGRNTVLICNGDTTNLEILTDYPMIVLCYVDGSDLRSRPEQNRVMGMS
jgi:hypothetical protein